MEQIIEEYGVGAVFLVVAAAAVAAVGNVLQMLAGVCG